MNSNNFGTNPGHGHGHRASMQPTYQSYDMLNAQYSVQVNAPFNQNQAMKIQNPSENNLYNVGKTQQGESRAMYNTGATFAKSSGNFGLSSFARQVEEPIQQKDKTEKNSTDKLGSFYNKNYGNPVRDQKMAASAIFPTSNSSQAQFNRFPAFNLGWNQSNDQSSQSSQASQSSNSSTNQSNGSKNQSAKEKRERELMEIKKQLDELNKKMMNNADKNKNNPKPNQPSQELRPPKSAMISQSAIFDQTSNFGNNLGLNQYSQSKPSTTGLSIDQLYAQKKQNTQVKPTKEPDFTSTLQKPNYGLGANDWQTNFNQPKAYEGEKKVEDSTYKSYKTDKSGISEQTANFLQKYQIPSSKPSDSYQNFKTQTNNNSYTGISTQNQTKKSDPYSSNNYNVTSSSNSQNNNSQGYTPSQPIQSVQPLTENKPPIYNFSKPAQSSAQVTGGFKKKKGPVAEIIEAKNQVSGMKQMKQTMYPNTATSTGYHAQRQSIKKTQSINYTDESIPVPELKQFKISDFIVGKKMGKGQFGEVLLVIHKETGWLCGLKVMNKKDIKDQDYVGQIARQLSIQFYLMHRNIAQLYGYFEDQKNFYLLIQFCTGGQLLQKLKQQRRMNERDVSIIIRQVCQGIDYIHKQQIIHRDIKPENILFNYGVVKISDFGWAVYRGFGMRKTASGSPLYYPPEIVKGQAYDDKIDVWCIGMMTYECILGKIPFRVYTQMDLGRIVSDQITFPSWVDVTDEAKDFILKTLKKKGDERMQLKQMLRHPFITKHQQKELSPSILEQFKRVLS